MTETVDALVKRARSESTNIGSQAARELIEELCQALERNDLAVEIVEDLRERSLMFAEAAIEQSVSGHAFEAFAADKMAVMLRLTARRIEKQHLERDGNKEARATVEARSQ